MLFCEKWQQTNPRTIALTDNQVHIWAVDLNWSQAAVNAAYALLSKVEQARADRFVVAQPRCDYVVSQAVLRDILARYLSISISDIQLAQDKQGKPCLQHKNSALQFNKSHTHGLAYYAISKGHFVGVDVEYIKPDIAQLELAQRFFSAKEVDQLVALPKSKQLHAFYQCWVKKEAYIKMIGQGLYYGLDQFSVDILDNSMQCLLEDKGVESPSCLLGLLLAPSQYVAALACDAQDTLQLHYWHWQNFSAR